MPVLLRILLLSALLLGTPLAASAKQETMWNFQDGIPGRWHVRGCAATRQTAEGFSLMSTMERCFIQRETGDIRHPIETLSITVLSPTQTDVILLWHQRDTPGNHMVELPISFSADAAPQTIRLNLPRYPQWDPTTDRIGFSLPKNSSLSLQKITFTRWSLLDKAVAAFHSFWTFDTFRPYSINFLWGPTIGWNPVWQEQLFTRPPPVGWSASRVFLSLLLAAFVLYLLSCRRQRTPAACRSAALALGSMFVGFWLLFDARMGLELLSYVKADWETFLLQPPGARRFRIFENFPDIAAESIPLLTTSPWYGFVGPHGAPFGSLLRYYTYPAARPVSPNDTQKQRELVRHWLVAFRNDARISPSGELFLGDTLLAGPGTIVKQFGKDAFVFAVNE